MTLCAAHPCMTRTTARLCHFHASMTKQQRYQQANRDFMRAYQRNWRAQHRDAYNDRRRLLRAEGINA